MHTEPVCDASFEDHTLSEVAYVSRYAFIVAFKWAVICSACLTPLHYRKYTMSVSTPAGLPYNIVSVNIPGLAIIYY